MNFSKSKYCRGIQCPKMLWMEKHMPDEAEEQDNEEILETGNAVGDLAMGYFGDFREIPYSDDKREMVDETWRLMEEGENIICEASFIADNLFCAVDILRRNGDGWDIIEVKSSTHIKDIYYHDMAFQCYVLRGNGLKIKGVYNLHINTDYVREGDLDLKQLFTLADCTGKVFAMQGAIYENLRYISDYVDGAGNCEPDRTIGKNCEQPYLCAFLKHCAGELPEHNVFGIAGLRKDKKYELYNSGIVSFEDVLQSGTKLSKNQLLQVESSCYHNPDYIDAKKIKECISDFTFPLYHLDFETTQFAIPPFDGLTPFEQLPFQYSLHIERDGVSEPEHREFLAEEGTDPRRALAESLCRDIPANVRVLAYNMSFEKEVIKRLAGQFPDLSEHLTAIYDNLRDLMTPFSKKYYYTEKMQGSYSIKYVLPALCPGDPELDYKGLDEIHKGNEASEAFANLANKTPEEIERNRRNLLAYCRLDTLAMVKVLRKLRQEIC